MTRNEMFVYKTYIFNFQSTNRLHLRDNHLFSIVK